MKTICLGIESTAHTFGAAVLDGDGNILGDKRDSYSNETGGIIPIDAAKHHEEVAERIINEALEEARLTFDDITLITVAGSPGLPPCLREGMKKAKELAKKHKKPLLAVNHAVAHLTSGTFFTKMKNPIFVYVSGANTQIISLEGEYFRIFGETEDVGMGNALDKLGRGLGLGFPAGPKIEELAKKGSYTELPYSVKGMDLTFSGIVTETINRFKKGMKKEDLCFSFQETIFAMLTEVTERALAYAEKDEVVLIGGVAANQRLVKMLDTMCKERKAKFEAVPLNYTGDQAVMIAWQGILEHKAGRKQKIEEIDIDPNERADDVKVIWV